MGRVTVGHHKVLTVTNPRSKKLPETSPVWWCIHLEKHGVTPTRTLVNSLVTIFNNLDN